MDFESKRPLLLSSISPFPPFSITIFTIHFTLSHETYSSSKGRKDEGQGTGPLPLNRYSSPLLFREIKPPSLLLPFCGPLPPFLLVLEYCLQPASVSNSPPSRCSRTNGALPLYSRNSPFPFPFTFGGSPYFRLFLPPFPRSHLIWRKRERAADVANPPLPPPSVPQPLSVQNSGRHCRIIAPPPFESALLRHKAINWQYVLLLLLSLPCGADWRSLHPILPRSQNWEDGGTIRARGVCTITVQCTLLSTLFSCFAIVLFELY